jgi:hypothetical protein
MSVPVKRSGEQSRRTIAGVRRDTPTERIESPALVPRSGVRGVNIGAENIAVVQRRFGRRIVDTCKLRDIGQLIRIVGGASTRVVHRAATGSFNGLGACGSGECHRSDKQYSNA